ncbi:hypothetical protein GJAV_G00008820 [Gymnothorax javanicus]|nr:hypothetical protein GJAV_G00008820 [Gymnothorax javanicus]
MEKGNGSEDNIKEMAGAAEDKGRGLKFAEQQLLRHGWEQGKGLGRDENGISEAIKVKVKCDKGGVGHSEGEQFTFHWWDHIFNKASSSLVVETSQDGIKVKKVAGEEEEGKISNKKPRKAELAKAKLYGRFVKSGTLWSGDDQTAKNSSASEDSSESEDEDQRLDLSSTTKLSDEDLVKACGGRTAHKGARHGLTMSAKLARLEQQELEFLAKYSKKSETPKAISNSASPNNEEPRSDEGKRRKKKNKKSENKDEGMVSMDLQTTTHPVPDEPAIVPRKKRKRCKEKSETAVEGQSSSLLTAQKSHKKKRRAVFQEGETCDSQSEVKEGHVTQNCGSTESAIIERGEEYAAIPEAARDDYVSRKKKRSKSKVVTSVETEDNCCGGVESRAAETIHKKKKASDNAKILQLEHVEQHSQVKRNKKSMCSEQERVSDGELEETRTVKKKKKKRSCEPECD